MSFEITGKLIARLPIIQRTETFKTREFVIEKSEEINSRVITNYIKLQCVYLGEACDAFLGNN